MDFRLVLFRSPSGRSCYYREAECAVGEVASASDGRTLVTLMSILGGVAALYLIWLLFRLATFALPVYSAVGAGLFVHAQGYGTAAMLLAGFTTGLIVYLKIGRASCRERVCQYV